MSDVSRLSRPPLFFFLPLFLVFCHINPLEKIVFSFFLKHLKKFNGYNKSGGAESFITGSLSSSRKKSVRSTRNAARCHLRGGEGISPNFRSSRKIKKIKKIKYNSERRIVSPSILSRFRIAPGKTKLASNFRFFNCSLIEFVRHVFRRFFDGSSPLHQNQKKKKKPTKRREKFHLRRRKKRYHFFKSSFSSSEIL